MSYFYNSQFFFGDVIVVFFLLIALRGLIFKKPFLISSKWLTALTVCILINCLGPIFFISKEFQMMGLLNILFIVFIFSSILIRQQGYMLFGITNTSMRQALLHSLNKLGIGYEETLGVLKLSSEAGEIQAMCYGWTGSGIIRGKKIQDKNLLGKVATEVNSYFQTNEVEASKSVFIRYLIIGIFFAFMPMSINMISKPLHPNDGWGKETYSDGSIYEGNFKNGEPSGHGKVVWEDGRSQEGDYLDGQLNGNVIMKYVDGSIFEGVCRNGFEYCKGVLQYKNGLRLNEEIKNGEFTVPYPTNSK